MAARLNSLPEVTIEAGGASIPPEAARALEKVRVAQRLSQPTQCELVFSVTAESSAIDTTLAPGTEIKLSTGGAAGAVFTGQVTALEYVYGPSNKREILIRAYDKLHSLRKRQTIRTFSQATLSSVTQELCADLNLTIEAVEAGPEYQWLIQHRQSDWQFLVQIAERCGLYLTLREDTLHLLTLDGVGEAVELALGDSLLEARIEANGDAACRTVAAGGWYPIRAESYDGLATTARSGRSVTAEAPPDRMGGILQRSLVDEAAQGDSHVSAIAQAELDRRTAGEVVLWGVANGDVRLCPGIPVDVSGVAPAVAGRYVLTEVTHTIDSRLGFVSEISSGLPPPGERAVGTIVTLGEVSQINDPDNLGRIRVKLPTYNNIETDWMGVVIAGAGKGKGLLALPDVGDRVVVLLAHEDPGQGIVLGGLYGTTEPPDTGLEGNARRRFMFVTPGGQRIQLDDAKNMIHVENNKGSYLELSPEVVRLHATVNLEIEAPGKQIAIRASAIDFNQA